MTITRRDVLRSMLAVPVAVAGAKVVGASTALAKVPVTPTEATAWNTGSDILTDLEDGFASLFGIHRMPGETDAQLRDRCRSRMYGPRGRDIDMAANLIGTYPASRVKITFRGQELKGFDTGSVVTIHRKPSVDPPLPPVTADLRGLFFTLDRKP